MQGPEYVVIDTQIVLDLFVFDDPGTLGLHEALRRGRLAWLATPPMRDELGRVLGYARIVPRLAAGGRTAGEVLARFDAQVQSVEVPARAPLRCSDPDDQMFIDLAFARQAILLSKDRAVRALRKRLAPWSVRVLTAFHSEPSFA